MSLNDEEVTTATNIVKQYVKNGEAGSAMALQNTRLTMFFLTI